MCRTTTHIFLALIPALLTAPLLLAQRGGGGGGRGAGSRRPLICVYDCPETKTDKDDQTEARIARLIAVQATPEQSAALLAVLKETQSAVERANVLHEAIQKSSARPALADQEDSVHTSVRKILTDSAALLSSFSSTQESGLRETTKKMNKAGLDVQRENETFERAVENNPDAGQTGTALAKLGRALSSLHGEQSALAGEMSVGSTPETHDTQWRLNAVTDSAELGGYSTTIVTAAALSPRPAANGSEVFDFRYVTDLSDLQQDITGILRSLLNQSRPCGERVEILEAHLMPQASVALLDASLHYERWLCMPGSGTATELASSDGKLQVKLTPSLDKDEKLSLTAEIAQVTAEGVLRESLVSGNLGSLLSDGIRTTVLSGAEKVANKSAFFPDGLRQTAKLQKVRFRDAGSGRLNIVADGELPLSEEQAKQLRDQLRQELSASGGSPQ
jgi:hypothetical protein